MKKIGLMEIKQALRDGRFRDALPINFKEDIVKFLQNPSCACNVPLYRRILKECKNELLSYFPDTTVADEAEENHWSVINCHIDYLEAKLRALAPGRKQIDVSRYGDQVTVVVNELDVIF